MGAPSPAHHLVGGASVFDLKCLRTPKRWALGTRSSRELHSIPYGHISPQRPDSFSCSSRAHHLVGGASVFDLKCLRTPKRWALGTRSSRELHSIPYGHISPQRPDSFSCFKTEQGLFQAFSSLSSSLPGK